MKPWTSWVRLHPVALDPTLAEAVRARIADPLFLLGRQWQTGGSGTTAAPAPIDVRVETETAPVVVADADTLPLEAALEREDVPEYELLSFRLRRESGQQLVRMLRLAGLSDRVAGWTIAVRSPSRRRPPIRRPRPGSRRSAARSPTRPGSGGELDWRAADPRRARGRRAPGLGRVGPGAVPRRRRAVRSDGR